MPKLKPGAAEVKLEVGDSDVVAYLHIKKHSNGSVHQESFALELSQVSELAQYATALVHGELIARGEAQA